MAEPVIIAPKDPVLVDQRIELKVINLGPFQHITLTCDFHEKEKNGRDLHFKSYGHFISDIDGIVNVSYDASLGGTYRGVDGMGLFWSMLPAPGQRKGARFTAADVTRPMHFRVALFNGHLMQETKASNPKKTAAILPVPLATAVILRMYLSDDVDRSEICVGRIRGTLFRPKGERRCPGVIDLFGSHGGLLEYRAALLASHGFVVLALAFFNYKDLPTSYFNLDFSYFVEAAEWLANHQSVYQNGIGIVGVSYGGQVALHLAAECPIITAVVAISSPNSMLTPVMYKGNSIGYQNEWDVGDVEIVGKDTLYFGDSVDIDSDEMQKVEIKVENITGKLLVICGMEDKSICANKMATRMEKRLKLHRRPELYRLDYPGAGHLIEPPYMPMCNISYHKTFGYYFLWGGKVEQHSTAQEHCWKALRNFLHKHIKQTKSMM